MGLTVHQSAVFTVKAKALQCLQVLPMQGVSVVLRSISNTYLVACMHMTELEEETQGPCLHSKVASHAVAAARCWSCSAQGATCHQQYFCCRQYARQEIGIPALQYRPVQRVACKMLRG